MDSCLIFGSSKGLGRELYQLLESKGYEVKGIARSTSDTVDFECDLTNSDEVDSLYQKIRNALPNHLIFNTGQGKSTKKDRQERKDELMRQNLLSSTLFLDTLISEKEGLDKISTITFINSICSLPSMKCSEEYSSAKIELQKYADQISKDLVSRKIRVNSILPGDVMHENSVWNSKFDSQSKENDYLEKNVPFGKWITPQDIGSALEFIFSNKQLTANRLIIDGGQHLSSPN